MKTWEKARTAFKYLIKFKELVAVLVFLWLAFVSPLQPDVRITYNVERFSPPLNAVDALAEIAECNGKAVLADFLQNIRTIVVEITTCRHERIVDFDLQMLGVEAVSGIGGVTTSSKLDADLTELLTHNISQNGVLNFPNLTEIPPKAKLWITVYGSFSGTPYDTPIRARASAQQIKIGEERELSGFALFLGSNAGTIVILISVTLLLVGLRRIKNG